MYKKRKNILCLLMALMLTVSTSMAVLALSSDGTRYNNVLSINTYADISGNGLLTVDYCFKGRQGVTTKGEITSYVEKKILGLFWVRVDIGQPNNQWYDLVYDYKYNGSHTCQLSAQGTYRITVVYVISGSGGAADTITERITTTY